MLDAQCKEKILNAAIEIGDMMLDLQKTDEHGTYWETMSLGPDKDILWTVSEGIYSGSAGIVVFLLELYKQTGDERYKTAAIAGGEWLINYTKAEETDYYAFFTGRMGTAYTLLILADFTGEDRYKTEALRIGKEAGKFLAEERTIDDLINGTSGTLMGLLHLHAATGDAELLPIVDTYIERLVKGAILQEGGVFTGTVRTSIFVVYWVFLMVLLV